MLFTHDNNVQALFKEQRRTTRSIFARVEYAWQFWHFNIQKYLSEDIEQTQRVHALRILFPLLSHREARDFTGIPLLKAKRDLEILCEQFFKNNENNDNLSELLHLKATTDYDMRLRYKYNNQLCRTEHFRKSFFPQPFPESK